MPDQDKDAFEVGEPNEFVPGEEDFDDEFADGEDEAPEEAPAQTRAQAREEAAAGGRRFRIGRGDDGQPEEHVPGSLRAAHERIHVDDRASAVFALLCAIGLVAILIGGYFGQYAPKPGAKPLPTLDLPTFQPTASPSPSGSASLAPTASPTATPTATPTPAPSAS